MSQIIQLKTGSTPKIKMTEEQISSLVKAINERLEHTADFARSKEGSCGDYLLSVGYGGELLHQIEDRINNRSGIYGLEDDVFAALKFLFDSPSMTKRDKVEFIQDICDFEHIDGIKARSFEVASIDLCTEQIEVDDLHDFDTIDHEDFATLSRAVDGFLDRNGWASVSFDYERVSLVIDPEKLEEKLSQMIGAQIIFAKG